MTQIASALQSVADGIWHWHLDDPDVDGHVRSSHAVRVLLDDGRIGCVLVDPVRLDGHAMQQLPHVVVAVVLTSSDHQDAAWRLRHLYGARIWAPAEEVLLSEDPDERYGDGDELPGGIVAVHTPCLPPGQAQYSLHIRAHDALLVPDLLVFDDQGGLAVVPGSHEGTELTRASIESLARLRPKIVLLDHGEPITDDATGRLEALARA